MPNYVYICEICEYEEERFGVFSSMPKTTKCPKCLKKSFIRCIGTGTGFKFIGSGFYETDYKKNKDADKEMNKIKKQMRDQSEI